MAARDSHSPTPAPAASLALKDAVRDARIEAADRSGVVVDLRDAEMARLELLNEQLDPLFRDIPADVDLFDRGLSRGDVPRLWLDMVAHVEMGRDKREFRFVQDTRYGRAVLAESYEATEIVREVTRYIARRMVEREKALSDDAGRPVALGVLRATRRRHRWARLRGFLLGLIVGVGALLALALLRAH